MSVVNVENYLVTSPTSINIGEFTLEKDLMSAVNVGSLLAKAPVSFNTRRYTPDNGLMSDVIYVLSNSYVETLFSCVIVFGGKIFGS